MEKKKCEYLKQNCNLTLREGMEEFYRENPQLLHPTKLNADSAQVFILHDRIHVLFGCDTNLLQEVRSEFWSLLGSDVGVMNYVILTSPAVRDLYKDLKQKETEEKNKELKTDILRSVIPVLTVPLKVYRRTRKMTKKWPWADHEHYLDRPLKELREEFNIRIFE